MRWPTEPPKHVEPARLWRLLASCGRPTLPITYRLSFAPDLPLAVRGLTGLEFAEILDQPTEDGADRTMSALIAAALWAGEERAFLVPGDADRLYRAEHHALALHVLDALAVVSPCSALVDVGAWRSVLSDGALHATNISAACGMADCCDTALGMSASCRSPRPDRWFGRCVGELTDGQRMAFDAAFERVWKIRGGKHG